MVRVLAQFFVGKSELVAQAAPAARRIFCGFGPARGGRADGAQEIGEVRGKDEEGLGEGKDERRDDNDGNHGEEFANDALPPNEREEGGDGCADAAEDRPHDLTRAAHGGFDRIFALAVEPENVFADDDGIIHDHA
jgi:hypothetical protein